MRKCASLAVVFICFFFLVPQAFGDTVVLKQGTEYRPGQTYYGTTDTWLDYYNETTNYGTSDYMYVYMNNDTPRKSGPIKFDLASIIPANAEIQSATLSLYLWGTEDMGSGDWVDVGTYQIGQYRDWVETQATWYVFKGSSYWGTAGCEYVPSDRAGTYTDTNYFDDDSVTGVYYDWDVTSSVEAWYAGTAANNGWLMRVWRHDSVAGEGVIFGTKDATLGVRPKLTITYEVTIIPEPGMPALVALGVLGLLFRRRAKS